METLMATFCNAVSPDREEEMNNWYTWVHIRDVMSMDGSSIAVQRFELDTSQPENADLSRKFLALYEVADKAICSDRHMTWQQTLKLEISSSFDLRTFSEAYWDPTYGTAAFSAYADYAGDKSVLMVRLDGKERVEAMLTLESLEELAALPGIKAAHLFCYGADQMPTSAAGTETMSHMLVAQLDDSACAAASWNAFAAEKQLSTLQAKPVIYRPIIDRFHADERIKSPEWRAITYLSHAILGTSEKSAVFGSRK